MWPVGWATLSQCMNKENVQLNLFELQLVSTLIRVTEKNCVYQFTFSVLLHTAAPTGTGRM